MNKSLEKAMQTSRMTRPLPGELQKILAAEQIIARMTDAERVKVRHQLDAKPNDGFLRLWNGLVLAGRGEHSSACDEFLRASECGCNNWRVGWYLAQSAKATGNLPLMDEACAAVLRANKEFWFARELPKHARGFYAQGEHDKLIEAFFVKHPPRSKVFVEVGAFDGVHYSNVRRLVEQHGWSGVSIEPVAKNFAKLEASYRGSKVRCVRACVSDREGEVELNVSTYPHLADWGSDVASISGEDTDRWRKQYGAVWTKEKVPVRHLTSILDESGVADVDLLSVDAEGHDLEVLRGLDFDRFKPQLIVVEYGKQREAILRFLEERGYSLSADNNQDLFMARPSQRTEAQKSRATGLVSIFGDESRLLSGSDLSAALEKLNPHLLGLNTLPLDAGVSAERVDPIRLVTPERFDLLVKHIYARHRALGVDSEWARDLYRAHISAFSNGSFKEGDGRKSRFEDYLRAFDATLDSIASRGFDPQETLVPIGRNNVLIDGAHRIAACLFNQKTVDCLRFDLVPNAYGADFFEKRGLSRQHLDAAALECCRLCEDTYLVHLFPKAQGCDAEVRAILREYGGIFYEKEIQLDPSRSWWLIRQLYRNEKWVGSWSDNFAGARRDASVRFDGTSPLRVIVFQCDELDRVKEAKARIRALYGAGNFSSHINDTHEETVRLGQLYFNANSLHFLNNAQPRFLEKFEQHLESYRVWLRMSGLDSERFCVDGSSVMAAYGLRDAQDLDVLHFGEADFSPVEPKVNSHNGDVHHHVLKRDELIFNPAHHFYYDGLKFVSLAALCAMKEKRNEGKDRKDVALMTPLLNPGMRSAAPSPSAPGAAAALVPDIHAAQPAPVTPKTSARIYYIPNGNDYHIAALLNDMFTEVKPFGCRDVRDYIERRVLAYQTPDASEQLWREVQAMRPDIVYVESGRNIEPAVLQRIRSELSIPVTMWFGDACVNEKFIERLMAYAPCVDWQIVVDRRVADVARERGLNNVEFIPFFGYDHYFRPLNAPKTLEILFSGKSYDDAFGQYPFARERLAFVRRVNSEFGRRLALVGEGWSSYGLANYHPERVPEWEVNELNNHAKIVLAFDAAHVREFTSCRTYHAMLGRSFVVIRKFPGIENLFVNGEHLVWFETEGEGIALLRHYLDQPAERERIAEGGYQHVHRNGWKFSNIVRYLIQRGLRRETRAFEQIYAPYSRALPQRIQQGGELMDSRAAAAPVALPTECRNAQSGPRLSSAAQGCLEQAETFFNQGRLPDARDWLERALDLEPDQFDLLIAFARLSLQLGSAAGAETALTHAVQLKPDDSAARVLLASAQYAQGKIEEFEQTLSHVLRSNPSDPAALRFLADLNLEHKRFKEAAINYFKLLKQDERDIESLLGLGVCFFKTGDSQAARMMFERVLEVTPGHALAAENLRALEAAGSRISAAAEPSRTPVATTTTLAPQAGVPSKGIPIISAIVSTYNSEHFLRHCLEDLEAQTIADQLEIIVVDSGSSQNERAIVEEFQKRYSNIRYLRTERETIYAAWNRGVQMARGKYLTNANADDRHTRDAYEKMVAALEARPDCALAYADVAICENVHPDRGYTEIRGYFRWPEFDVRLLFRDCYMGPQPVWRRDVHQQHGLFDPAFKSAGDYEFWLRMACTERFLHVPEVLGLYWNTPQTAGHADPGLTRREADVARERHWPKKWGARPEPGFSCVEPTAFVRQTQQTVSVLQARVRALESEKNRLETDAQRWITSRASVESGCTPLADNVAATDPVASLSLLQTAQERLRERKFSEANAAVARYREVMNSQGLTRRDGRTVVAPRVSVVIVSYNAGEALLDCIRSVGLSAEVEHEIILVDNGGNDSVKDALALIPLLHVTLPVNLGPAEARNIGSCFARAPILCFLDDDAVAAPGYLASIVKAFDRFEIQALRGKVLPKTANLNNRKACHYDLGNVAVPSDLDTEGNSAVLTTAWREAGGMNPLLFGGEGLELSYRLARKHGESAIIYWPEAVIHHDYALTDEKLERKQARHELMRAYAVSLHSDVFDYHRRVTAYVETEDARRAGAKLVRRKTSKSAAQVDASVTTLSSTLTQIQPYFSICIPTHNRAGYLPEAIQSALRQTYPNFEVVVVDDGSTDGTPALLKGFASEKVRSFRKEHSGGPETRNRCVAEARGEFVVWLDSDDVILPGTLELYARALRREPGVDVFYGDLQLANEQLVYAGIERYRDYHGWSAALLSDLFLENQIPNGFTMIRKACFEKVGGYDRAFPRAHDYEFWTRLAGKFEVRHLDEVVGIYRLHDQSLSKPRVGVDTRYEAAVAKAMLNRDSLRELLPWCFGDGVSDAAGEGNAARVVALQLLKHGDVDGAREWMSRTAKSPAHSRSTAFHRLLSSLHGGSARNAGSDVSTEYGRAVEDAVREFQRGRARECARACARLTDLKPDASETLLLVGSSLMRWGDPQNGRAALHCLLHREIGETATEVANAVERCGDPASSKGERALQDYIASVLGVEAVPAAALSRALNAVREMASVVGDQRGSFSQESLTPLFFAVLGMTEADAATIGQTELWNDCTKVKRKLAAEHVPVQGPQRRSGYSFCIITNGRRPEKLQRQIESIQALGVPTFEILVGGRVLQHLDGVTVIDLSDAATTGNLGLMRNTLAARAQFDRLVVSDDDMVFAPDFYQGLQRFGEGYDALAVKLVNPDGSRFWDWACVGGARGQMLLNYWDASPEVYVTGGICVLKASVWSAVRWDDGRGFYEAEDVDFSRRLQAAGFSIRFNPYARVTHDDDRYTRVGRKVMRLDDLLKTIDASCRAAEFVRARELVVVAERLCGNHPQQAVELRALLDKYSTGLSAAASNNLEVASLDSISVAWDGSFLDLGSLSHVNRELTRALEGTPGVALTRLGKNAVPKALAGMKSIVDCARKLRAQPSQRAQVTVRHAWPPNWEAPADGAWVLIQPWEFGALPKEWVHNLARVDEAWVPSEYVRRVYVDSGVDPAKVHVVPNGIDPAVFHPAVKPMTLATKKSWKFLFVGGTILRKGPDVLLKAYLEAFTDADDVCLVIKDFGGQSVYAGQTFEAQVEAAQATPNAPEILYLNAEFPPESLPGLYAACDALVHPYRGEGFGIPILEAMACGLPVVVTAGGAADDFATDEFAYRLPSIRRTFGQSVSGMELAKPGWMLEPDHNALVDRMKWLVAHRDEGKSKGLAASEHVRREWNWQRAAQKAATRVQALAARTPKAVPVNSPRKAKAIELPTCARLGHLGEARQLFQAGKLVQAWNSAVIALKVRPYHPEAFILLAEIANAAGDGKRANTLSEHARKMAPKLKAARKLPKSGGAKNGVPRLQLPELPPYIDLLNGKLAAPRLSVFVIAKNEEKFIGRCLESVRDLATQIVVVDSGSTDWTKSIAERFGAEVVGFEWCDDFSAARNAALERVTGDWVLMLDADEELLPDQEDKLRALLAEPSVVAWRLPMRDVGREAEGEHFVPRLFRNAPGLFYLGRIHEQIFSSVEVRRQEWGLENRFGDAVLLHHGYTKEMVQSRDKIARNLRLLRLAVEELPGEPNLLMNLGLELVRDGQLDAGLEQYAAAHAAMVELPRDQVTPELRESLITQYASHLISAKRPTEAVRVLESPPVKSAGLTASMHWLLGLAYIEQRQPGKGAAQMRECLAKRGRKSFTPVDRNVLKGGPSHCLALCLAALQQPEPANKAFRAAIEAEPESRKIRFDYARFLAESGNEVEALKWLHQLATEDASDIEVWICGGQVALRRPEYFEFASDWTGESFKLHSTHPVIVEQRAMALLLNGDSDGALSVWRQSAAEPSASRAAAMALCEVLAGAAVTPVASALVPDVSREFLQWYRRLLSLNARRLVGVLHERLERLRPVLPAVAQLIGDAVNEANAVPVK